MIRLLPTKDMKKINKNDVLGFALMQNYWILASYKQKSSPN